MSIMGYMLSPPQPLTSLPHFKGVYSEVREPQSGEKAGQGEMSERPFTSVNREWEGGGSPRRPFSLAAAGTKPLPTNSRAFPLLLPSRQVFPPSPKVAASAARQWPLSSAPPSPAPLPPPGERRG